MICANDDLLKKQQQYSTAVTRIPAQIKQPSRYDLKF